MNESVKKKRYYWLKLNEGFFDQPVIKKLRKIAGGDTYTCIYLKMMLMSVKTEGVLIYEGLEETLEKELALKLDEDEKTNHFNDCCFSSIFSYYYYFYCFHFIVD